MERGSHKPSNKSYTIHVQMLNESGEQVGAYKLLTVDGVAKAQIPISSVLTPGYYQLIAHTGYMKNFDQRFFFKTAIEVRKAFKQKSLKVSFDKAAYKPGDMANVSFMMCDIYDEPLGKERFICEYLLNGERIKIKRFRCYEDGTMAMSFLIPEFQENDVLSFHLSYYNTGEEQPLFQEVHISLVSDKIQLDFFPEGGDMIQGLPAKVAFKATDSRGVPIDVDLDFYEDNKKIAQISSLHQGMGIIPFTPQAKAYSVKVSSHTYVDSVYQLPEIKSEGYTLALNTQNKDAIVLGMNHNYLGERSCKLWISYCDSLLDVKDMNVGPSSIIELSKDKLPNGIVTFTLSENDVPKAERLVYIDKPSAKLSLGVSGHTFDPREKVELTFKTDSVTKTSLSFAVVDSSLSYNPKLFPANIKTYALFESELKGRIFNPNQYLGSDRTTSNKRDLLLLTHGWRRFEWISNDKCLQSMQIYDFNRVTGEVTRLKRPYANAKIAACMLGKTILYSELETDELGRFYIDPVYKEAIEQNLLLMSRSRKNRRGVTLRLNNTDTIRYKSVLAYNEMNLLPYITSDYTIDEDNSLVEEKSISEDYEGIQLKEFEVSADKENWDMSHYFRMAEDAALGKDLEDASSFYWVLQQFSNVVFEADNGYRLRVKTIDEDRPHVIYINKDGWVDLVYGFELDMLYGGINCKSAMIYVNGEPWGYDVAPLDYLKASEISSIAILDGIKGEELFGIEAYYGAIMVETYDKNLVNQYKLHNSHAVFGNFVRSRQFASPQYDTKEQIKTGGDDNRVTLHWEPLLETDENGEAQVSFYTGDIPGKKQIIVQGFDDEGNLYYETGSFVVKDVLER